MLKNSKMKFLPYNSPGDRLTIDTHHDARAEVNTLRELKKFRGPELNKKSKAKACSKNQYDILVRSK
jgi:hypothetical protein